MDMWDPYLIGPSSTSRGAGEGRLRPFHIMKHMGERWITSASTNTESYAKGPRDPHRIGVPRLYSAENLPAKHKERFAVLRQDNLKTARAWAIKESLRVLWHYRPQGWAKRFWTRWYFWATHSKPEAGDRGRPHDRPTARGIAQLLLEQPDHERRCGGAELEDPDDQEDGLRVRNPEHFKTAIFFHGGLDLYPATHGIA